MNISFNWEYSRSDKNEVPREKSLVSVWSRNRVYSISKGSVERIKLMESSIDIYRWEIAEVSSAGSLEISKIRIER
jgi:hypothetical protein